MPSEPMAAVPLVLADTPIGCHFEPCFDKNMA